MEFERSVYLIKRHAFVKNWWHSLCCYGKIGSRECSEAGQVASDEHLHYEGDAILAFEDDITLKWPLASGSITILAD